MYMRPAIEGGDPEEVRWRGRGELSGFFLPRVLEWTRDRGARSGLTREGGQRVCHGGSSRAGALKTRPPAFL